MAEGFITRKGGAPLEITGQQIITGEYQEAINKFDTVLANEIPAVFEGQWDTSITQLGNPNILPPANAYSLDFSFDDKYLAVSHEISPFITIYKRDGDDFTKLPNPAILPIGGARGTSFSRDGVYLAVSHFGSPYITIYKRDGDTFTKLANPDVLPPNNSMINKVNFSNDGNYLAVGHDMSFSGDFNFEALSVYKRNGDSFTRLSVPQEMGLVQVPVFSNDGTYLAVIGEILRVLKRDGDNFNLIPNALNSSFDVFGLLGGSFSPDGTYLAVADGASPFIAIYKRDGDDFTKLPNPAILPTGNGNQAAFSPDGVYLVISHFGSPYITIYKRDGDTFTKIDDPVTSLSGFGNGNESAFSNSGVYLSFVLSMAPYLTTLKTTLEEIEPAYNEIVKANNLITDADDLGYALEDGNTGETKTIMSLFRKE